MKIRFEKYIYLNRDSLVAVTLPRFKLFPHFPLPTNFLQAYACDFGKLQGTRVKTTRTEQRAKRIANSVKIDLLNSYTTEKLKILES